MEGLEGGIRISRATATSSHERGRRRGPKHWSRGRRARQAPPPLTLRSMPTLSPRAAMSRSFSASRDSGSMACGEEGPWRRSSRAWHAPWRAGPRLPPRSQTRAHLLHRRPPGPTPHQRKGVSFGLCSTWCDGYGHGRGGHVGPPGTLPRVVHATLDAPGPSAPGRRHDDSGRSIHHKHYERKKELGCTGHLAFIPPPCQGHDSQISWAGVCRWRTEHAWLGQAGRGQGPAQGPSLVLWSAGWRNLLQINDLPCSKLEHTFGQLLSSAWQCGRRVCAGGNPRETPPPKSITPCSRARSFLQHRGARRAAGSSYKIRRGGRVAACMQGESPGSRGIAGAGRRGTREGGKGGKI